MELVLALGIGVFTSAGTWLILRPRTFQVILGLSLLSYAVNLFIYAMGRLRVDAPPVVGSEPVTDFARYSDPLPQALVLTAIVISFAMTALLLVVLIAAHGLTGTDKVDGDDSP
jgi:multicomponent K+:H+ antiporter subunit C